MRGKKLQRQINKSLDYDEVESELGQLVEWAQSIKDNSSAENALKVFENLPSFFDAIESSYEQYETNLNHAQRSLELSGQEVEERNKLLRGENRKISNLLNNMRQAIFTVDPKFTILGPVSRYSEVIFHGDIVGKHVYEVLFKDIPRDSEQFSALNTAFISTFGEGEIQWDLMVDYFPNRIVAVFDQKSQQEQILKIATAPLWDDQENLEKIMFIVEDVTEFESLTRKIELEKAKNNRSLQIVQELISSSKAQVTAVFTAFDEMIQYCLNAFKQTQWDQEELNTIFRHLHTIKGNSRTYGLNTLSAITHKVESEYVKIRGNTDREAQIAFFNDFAPTYFSQLLSQVDEYKDMMRKIYQSNESSNEPLSDSNKTQVQRIQQILKASADRLPTQTWKEAEGILNELLGNSSFGFLKQFVTTAVEKLEEDCGKTVHVDISGEAFHLGDGQLRALQNCMVHIVRNAIDHGIENQDERVRFAKSPHGNLKVEFTVKGGLLNVSIQDDGKGLNYDKIREKIVNNGLASEDEVIAMNEGQLSEFIFKPGFTTADQVSEVSGRGMGLDAVRGDLELQEGKIWVESIAGKGTTFKIELPLSEQEAGLDQKDALKVAI